MERMLSTRPLLALFALTAVCISACSAPSDGDDAASSDDEEAIAGNAKKINVGFNVGLNDNIPYLHDYFDFASVIQPGPRLCHVYVQWNVADEAAGIGTASDSPSHRPGFEYWLQQVAGKCDEALISFKSTTNGAAPSVSDYSTAVGKFLTTAWSTETGFKGTFAFTAWNEPNNPESAGNGLGVVIEPESAAGYFMALESQCRANGGCKVAAGDFASNGTWWNAYEQNCKDDTVAEDQLCAQKSPENTTNSGPSYLDRYKNYIVNHATDNAFKLGNGFRPAYFAFHGWHDVNEYLDNAAHCTSYDNCVVKRLLTSLGGSWQDSKIWDTETGIDQAANDVILDGDQACGAAFVLHSSAISNRIERVYITRLHNGQTPIGGAILRGDALRPAGFVLAERETTYSGKQCQ
jgi:hypothetical protein